MSTNLCDYRQGCCNSLSNSLIEHYPNFNARLRESLRALVGEEVEKRVDIGMAKDGSGVGGQCPLLSHGHPLINRMNAF